MGIVSRCRAAVVVVRANGRCEDEASTDTAADNTPKELAEHRCTTAREAQRGCAVDRSHSNRHAPISTPAEVQVEERPCQQRELWWELWLWLLHGLLVVMVMVFMMMVMFLVLLVTAVTAMPVAVAVAVSCGC